jgi:hypothetical protein
MRNVTMIAPGKCTVGLSKLEKGDEVEVPLIEKGGYIVSGFTLKESPKNKKAQKKAITDTE